jgi:hypothetical protein
MKHFRPILIKAALNGLKVEVGCREFVYEEVNLAQFLVDLQDYILDPELTEKKFRDKYDIIAYPEPATNEQPVSERPVGAGLEGLNRKERRQA